MAAEGEDRGVVATCPCQRQVPLDYSTRDRLQAISVQAMIAQVGEFTVISIGQRAWRVSRHCIALHGVNAAEIDTYGFEELGMGK